MNEGALIFAILSIGLAGIAGKPTQVFVAVCWGVVLARHVLGLG